MQGWFTGVVYGAGGCAMGTLNMLLCACWLLVHIGQIAISDAGVLATCLLQEPGGFRVYASQGAEQACLSIFLRGVGF